MKHSDVHNKNVLQMQNEMLLMFHCTFHLAILAVLYVYNVLDFLCVQEKHEFGNILF
jgi:hypothetical protein